MLFLQGTLSLSMKLVHLWSLPLLVEVRPPFALPFNPPASSSPRFEGAASQPAHSLRPFPLLTLTTHHRRGDLALIKFLCAKGCKVNLVNKRGLTPLGEALVGGHVAAAEALLGVGAHADVTARG